MIRTPPLLAILLLFISPALAQVGAPTSVRPLADPRVRVVRPGLSGGSEVFSNSDLYAAVSESAQRTDLNGDSDLEDGVLHRISLRDGQATNLALDGSPSFLARGALAFTVFESNQRRRDLNGDGDRSDHVWHVYSESTGTITNLGTVGAARERRGLVALLVNELHQGADLNGDGDRDDLILHAWRLGLAPPLNLGWAMTTGLDHVAALAEEELVFPLEESLSGDANGDGDALDTVLHRHEARTGATTSLGLALRITSDSLKASADTVAFLVSEAGQGGVDLNGDGDALDDVVHLYDVEHGLRNLALASARTCSLACSPYFQVEDEWVIVSVPEPQQGHGDLDGDGDASDFVPHAHRIGSAESVALEVPHSNPDARFGYFWAGADFLTYTRSEEFSAADLNGEGDALDHVLFVRRFDADQEVNTGLAVDDGPLPDLQHPPEGDGDWIVFFVRERAQGGLDRNGDGDALDLVACLFDTRTGAVRNTALAGLHQVTSGVVVFPTFSLHDGLLVARCDESSQSADLNGDGDLLDDVLHVHDARSNRQVNTRAAAQSWPPLWGSRRVQPFSVTEGAVDLNGDGDRLDTVIEVLVIGSRLP